MKTPPVVFATLLIAFAGAAFTEVVVKEEPLSWQQVAITDGEELYVELCAVCHGKGGMGDGPAVAALKKAVPDLTVLAAANQGNFPRDRVKDSIAGDSRVVSHGTVDMPIWGQAFFDARPDIKTFRRRALANQRIYNLLEYLESIQAD